ncbi:MAG: hypothetical protein ACOVQX_00555 [Legionella sp.]
MAKWLSMLVFCCYSMSSFAFTCYFTAIKDSCWDNYNVTINVYDAVSNASILSVLIPQGSFWQRKRFECSAKQRFRYEANFNPVFWESDAGKSYFGVRFEQLPDEISDREAAWNLSLCYPADFAEVPFPPEGTSKCKCDKSQIPPIAPP